MPLVDPVDTLLTWLGDHWPMEQAGVGHLRVVTTGDAEAMRRGARRAFGVALGAIEALPVMV